MSKPLERVSTGALNRPTRRRLRPALALAGLLLVAVTTGCSEIRDVLEGPESPTTPSPSDELVYAAVGASDAVGIGASVSCIPFVPCPDGTGYVQIIARRLKDKGTVALTNLGIPAAVIGPEFQTLGNRYGRSTPGNFIEREMPFVPRTSALVTIFAGANDANVIAAAVDGGAGGSDPMGYIDAQVRTFAADYDTLIRGIRSRTPSARIVVANVPNFVGMPFTASHTLQRKQGIQKISVAISKVVNGLTGNGVTVVDLLCDARFYDPGVYSPDGFHPSDRGYSLMADLFLAAYKHSAACASHELRADDARSRTLTPMNPGDCTLFSGGAPGTEAAFGAIAEQYGVAEVNFTFPGHALQRQRGVRLLTDEELKAGDVSLEYVSRLMHRRYLSASLPKVLQTLWHQVSNGQAIYVVGTILDDKTVRGGTGWGAELAKLFNKPLHVFDQPGNAWFTWDQQDWIKREASNPPAILHALFTGTGTQYLEDNGRAAIADLFKRSFT